MTSVGLLLTTSIGCCLKIKVREPKNLQPVKAEVKIMAIGSNFHPIFDFQLLDH